MKILEMMQSNTARCPNCGREVVPGWGDCDFYNHSY